MKKTLRTVSITKYMITLLLFLLLGWAMYRKAYAAYTPRPLSISIEQEFQNADDTSIVENLSVDYRLTALEPGNPLPQGSQGDEYAFSVTGSQNALLPPITFHNPGVYSYELKDEFRAASGYKQENKVYNIEAYVRNGVADTLESDLIFYNEAGEKVEVLSFTFQKADTNGSEKGGDYDGTNQNGNSNNNKPSGWKQIRNNVKTGDNTNIVLWIVVMLTALSYLILLLLSKRRRNNDDQG